MYLVVVGYFVLVAIALALVIFPQFRISVVSALIAGLAAITQRVGQLGQSSSTFVSTIGRSISRSAIGISRFIQHNRLLATATVSVLIAPPLLALSLNKGAMFEYSELTNAPDERIAMLLRGERLVPPPGLAPEVFTTREVQLIRPETVWASRNWELLDPEFRQRLLLVFKLMRERHGYEVVLLEGYRSPERQTMLAARGSHVTQAAAYRSYHQYGLAADCAFLRNGKLVISEKDPWAMRGYQLYGELAEAAGLTWGGEWRMQDFGHVELRRSGVLGKPTTIASR